MKTAKLVGVVAIWGLTGITALAQQGHGSNDLKAMQGQGNCCKEQHKGMSGGHGKMKMSRIRHHFVRDNGIPSPYEEMTSPSNLTESNGTALYTNNCSSCHGVKGVGDGKDGVNLNPEPTNIARFAKMPMASDGYLFWTVAEGGSPVGSAMPAFKELLTEAEIWQVISYLKQLE